MIADQKRREYISLLAPYKGKHILDIPHNVLEKADKAMKAAKEADKKYAKLMGLED